MAEQVSTDVIDESGPVPVRVPELQQRREQIAQVREAPSENTESITDNSGPMPVNVDPLQQDREDVAKAGMAHASFRNGNVAVTASEAQTPVSTPSKRPARGSKRSPKGKADKQSKVRSSKTGRFVSADKAKSEPDTTETES